MNYSFAKTVEKVIIAFIMAFLPGITVTATLPDTAAQFQATWYLFAASLLTALAKGYDNYRKNSPPPSNDALVSLDYAALPASLLVYLSLPAAGVGVISTLTGIC
jgi:hypothetical protein